MSDAKEIAEQFIHSFCDRIGFYKEQYIVYEEIKKLTEALQIRRAVPSEEELHLWTAAHYKEYKMAPTGQEIYDWILSQIEGKCE